MNHTFQRSKKDSGRAILQHPESPRKLVTENLTPKKYRTARPADCFPTGWQKTVFKKQITGRSK
jgi:hypothetical protein